MAVVGSAVLGSRPAHQFQLLRVTMMKIKMPAAVLSLVTGSAALADAITNPHAGGYNATI